MGTPRPRALTPVLPSDSPSAAGPSRCHGARLPFVPSPISRELHILLVTTLHPVCTEQRQHRRIAVRCGATLDLGAGGLRLSSQQAVDTGTRLRLPARPTSTTQAMLLHGTVVRAVAARIGEGCELG